MGYADGRNPAGKSSAPPPSSTPMTTHLKVVSAGIELASTLAEYKSWKTHPAHLFATPTNVACSYDGKALD